MDPAHPHHHAGLLSDGTLEERVYYGQNWRADVSVVLSDAGQVKEWVKYSAYGVPFAITPADFNADGFVNGTDDDDFDAAYNGGAGAWDARVDLDLSGTLTSADDTLFTAEFVAGEAGGYRVLSRASLANRLGYAGYQHAPELAKTTWNVRFRLLLSELGRWMRRDPLGYTDSVSLFCYVSSSPQEWLDPFGLLSDKWDCVSSWIVHSVEDCEACCAKYGPPDPECLDACQKNWYYWGFSPIDPNSLRQPVNWRNYISIPVAPNVTIEPYYQPGPREGDTGSGGVEVKLRF